MKKYFLFFLIAAALFSCDVKRKDKIADDSKTDSLKQVLQKKVEDSAMKNTTTVQIIDSAYNFGTITEGEKVEYSYRFKNTGANPLVIFNATASCGCTVPEKPEKPILPGETGFIKVIFNSSGKRGHNEKDINVNSNADPAFPPLKLMGEIKDKQ
jgi:hypothetical protein